MKQYEVTFEAEICVTIDAENDEEAVRKAMLAWRRDDAVITDTLEVACLMDEEAVDDD